MLQAGPITAFSLQSCPGAAPGSRQEVQGHRQAGRCSWTHNSNSPCQKMPTGNDVSGKSLLGHWSGRVFVLANEIRRMIFISVDCYGKIHKICHCFLPGIIPEDVVCDLWGWVRAQPCHCSVG